MYFILCFEARKPHIVTFLTTVQSGTLNSPSGMPFAYSKKLKISYILSSDFKWKERKYCEWNAMPL